MTEPDWIAADRDHVWHPFDVLRQDHNLPVVSAKGSYLHLQDGRRLLDAVSSWWVNLHGHAHSHIGQAITAQWQQLEHVMYAGLAHRPGALLAQQLCSVLPGAMQRVFYSDNGSTAVEVALKMALQWQANQGTPKTKIVAIEGAYHGDTFGAMSVGGRSVFNRVFEPLLFDVLFIPFPNQDNKTAVLAAMKQCCEHSNIAAFIYEPLVQGASGMRIYSADTLNQLMAIAKEAGALCIADEVMTGFGRTGTLFASEQTDNKPDIICLSKGITGGFMPLGATACTHQVYETFDKGYTERMFYHGHSYTGNPMACAAALASLDLLLSSDTQSSIVSISKQAKQAAELLGNVNGVVSARSCGTILAVEVAVPDEGYHSTFRDKAYQYFLEKGILLRPLGNVLYILPPYCITEEEYQKTVSEIKTFLEQVG